MERFPPDDPREWLNRARSNLTRAQMSADLPGVYLEDLCFDAQQAAEKAIKGVLLHRHLDFPYVHDLAELLGRLETAGEVIPDSVRAATPLTRYAIVTRYPGAAEPVTRDDYSRAVEVATAVVRWAEAIITPPP
jgi:HEPN domain-containing protein